MPTSPTPTKADGGEGTGARTLVVAGVPEHFNIPFKLAADAGDTPEIRFEEVPQGTGALVGGLLSGKYDCVAALTAPLIQSMLKGEPIKFLGTHVDSPLPWGVFVHPDAAHQSIKDVVKASKRIRVGVSRMGSGSHSVAIMMGASAGGWAQEPEFVICETIGGLVGAIQNKTIDCFLWETFATRPYTRETEAAEAAAPPAPAPTPSGGKGKGKGKGKGAAASTEVASASTQMVREVGIVPTPWPAFMYAVRSEEASDESKGKDAKDGAEGEGAAEEAVVTRPSSAAAAATRRMRMLRLAASLSAVLSHGAMFQEGLVGGPGATVDPENPLAASAKLVVDKTNHVASSMVGSGQSAQKGGGAATALDAQKVGGLTEAEATEWVSKVRYAPATLPLTVSKRSMQAAFEGLVTAGLVDGKEKVSDWSKFLEAGTELVE